MKLPPGVPLHEIASAVGVSVSTVSRALNDSDRVSALTKEAVRGAVRDLARRRPARDGGTPTQPLLGLTHSHLASGPATRSLDSILEQVLVGIEIACLRAGYIPYPWQQSGLLATGAGEPFFGAVSGVIMTGGLVDRRVLDAIRARALPVAIIGGHVPDLPVPSVAADSQRGLYLATWHLLARGHRRIALINGPARTYTSFEKRAGYLSALIEAGLGADPALIRAHDGDGGFDAPAAETLTEAVLELAEPPTAILYVMDQMAEAGYRVCQRRGLRVPEDISIVGFHDDANAPYAQPPLTTVRVDRALWGRMAAERLLALIGGEPMQGTRTLLPVELVVRGSTARAPGAGG